MRVLPASLKNVDVLCENAIQLVEDARNKSLKFSKYSQEDFDNFIAQIKGRTKLSTDGAEKVIDLMKNKYGDSRWVISTALPKWHRTILLKDVLSWRT